MRANKNVFKSSTTSGFEEISNKLFEDCYKVPTPPIMYFLNQSLQQGEFPSALKKTHNTADS